MGLGFNFFCLTLSPLTTLAIIQGQLNSHGHKLDQFLVQSHSPYHKILMIAFIYSEKVSLYYYWLLFHSRPHVVFSLLVITLAGKILKLGQMVMIMMMMMMIFIVPPCSVKKYGIKAIVEHCSLLYMCCNSGEDLEVFAPSDNLPHKYTRWNLKISHNYFFFRKVPRISVF